MPAAVAIPLIIGGASAAASVAAAKMNSGAVSDASQTQNQYNDKALAAAQEQLKWQRQQYGNYLQQQQAYQGRLQPYAQMGQGAGTTLTNLLARSPYAASGNGQGNAAPITPQLSPMPMPLGVNPLAAGVQKQVMT